MIFFINFIDSLDKVQQSGAGFVIAAQMAFLQIPDSLNSIVPSLVLIAAIITFFLLSSSSEITIMRSAGLSLWQIIRPTAIATFALGIFWIGVIEPISIKMIKRFNFLEGIYVRNEAREVVQPQTGIWLKQINSEEKGAELVVQAKKVYRENIELNTVNLWFFDSEGRFYKRIDAEKMLLKENYWEVLNATINDLKNINLHEDKINIPTDLKQDFVIQKIVNNFQNEKLFSIFQLPGLIKDLHSFGFSSVKFTAYFNSLLTRPLLFVAMSFIACYFGIHHARNRNSIFSIFLGISVGLIFYIISSIAYALGSSGLISVFASTWVVTIIYLAIGVLLIYRKESF